MQDFNTILHEKLTKTYTVKPPRLYASFNALMKRRSSSIA